MGQGGKRAKNSTEPDTQSTEYATSSNTAAAAAAAALLHYSFQSTACCKLSHTMWKIHVIFPLVSHVAAVRTVHTIEPTGKKNEPLFLKCYALIQIKPSGPLAGISENYIKAIVEFSYIRRQANSVTHSGRRTTLAATVNSPSRGYGPVCHQAK